MKSANDESLFCVAGEPAPQPTQQTVARRHTRTIMAALSAKDIKIIWSQTRDSLELIVTVIGAIGTSTEPELKQATDEELILLWPPTIDFCARFFRPIQSASTRWKMCGNGKMEISIRKGEDALGSWARPFEDKLPYLAIDWDKWYEDSDDEGALADAFGRCGCSGGADSTVGDDDSWPGGSIQVRPLWIEGGDEASATDVADPYVEEFDVSIGDGRYNKYGWLEDWDKFLMEQRMLTMALFWNAESYETRIESATRLVDILRSADDQTRTLDGAIKGGDFGRLTLDTSVYSAVPRPARWLQSFVRMQGEQQVRVMEQLFMALGLEEKKVVVATFM